MSKSVLKTRHSPGCYLWKCEKCKVYISAHRIPFGKIHRVRAKFKKSRILRPFSAMRSSFRCFSEFCKITRICVDSLYAPEWLSKHAIYILRRLPYAGIFRFFAVFCVFWHFFRYLEGCIWYFFKKEDMTPIVSLPLLKVAFFTFFTFFSWSIYRV